MIGPLKLGENLTTSKSFVYMVHFNLLIILNSRIKPHLKLIILNEFSLSAKPKFVINKKNIDLIAIDVGICLDA